MPAECSPPSMQFARLDGRSVVADFGGGVMTSDAGTLLLGATDGAIGLVDRFSTCFSDGRTPGRVVHDVATVERMQQSRMGFYVHCGSEGEAVLPREVGTREIVSCTVPAG